MNSLIITRIDEQEEDITDFEQVSQITYHGIPRHLFTLNYSPFRGYIVLERDGELFYITSSDTNLLTVSQVIHGLGYEDTQIVIDWTESNKLDNVINVPVQYVQLNQISLYPSNVPIPTRADQTIPTSWIDTCSLQ